MKGNAKPMKPSDDIKRLYNIYKGKDAQTVDDIARETQLTESTLRRHIAKLVQNREWREVLILRDKKLRRAYVRAKQ